MDAVKQKLKKTILVSIGAILLIALLVILFISPITKYWVEKYDEKYTGRQITMDWAYVNPFTGYVRLSNFKIHELKSDSIFFSTQSLSINFEMLKMLTSTYEISQLTLNQPIGIVIQNKKKFNFFDLIEKFAPTSTDTIVSGSHFNILNVKIENGEFHFLEREIPINYFIKDVNFESTGKRWNTDTMAAIFSLKSGIGSGTIKGNFSINFENDDYRYDVLINKFDLNIIEQYLKDLTNYGIFTANLDADLQASGSFNDGEDVTASGTFSINDFHFGKNSNEDYASFDRLSLNILELSPKNKKYVFDSLLLNHPFLKYELYDKSDNFENMFGKGGANMYAAAADPDRFNLIIELGRYVKVLARNFFQSYYKINRLAIEDGDLGFNDFSINEKFSVAVNPLNILADSIDKNHERVNISLKSGIQPFGHASIVVSLNPKDTGDFDMQYHFQKVPAAMFNPYLISYTSFPLDRGTIELNGSWTVRNGEIQSTNHLLVIDPRVTKRIKNKNTNWLPMPLIMSFVREYGNVIDYEIPITGSLKNPQFHLRDVLFDILGNIFIKPVTTPYRMEVKTLETEVEKSLTLTWQMRQTVLRSEQEKFLEKISDFLEKNADATINVYQHQYAIKEKECILFFEAKKKYFLALNQKDVGSFSESDSEKVNKMSVKDSLFEGYLDKQIDDTLLFTIQDKCSKFIGSAIVNARFNQLNAEREKVFRFYFQKNDVLTKVKMLPAENTIPYNGFSFYKIKYKGELPASLLKAYHELQVLNDEAPRKKYEREQKLKQ